MAIWQAQSAKDVSVTSETTEQHVRHIQLSRSTLLMAILLVLIGYGTPVAGATANAGSAVLSTNADGTASLNGTASVGASVTWSKLTGLGTVSFSPANAAATTVTCSQAGTYRLRLSATDGGGGATSDVQVEIVPPGGLTNAEKADGFNSWFTGSDLSNFRSHGGLPIPTGDPNWFPAAGGIIRHVHGGPNLMSRSEYSFGVLRFEWSGNMDSGLLVLQPFGSNGGFDNQIQMGYRSGGYFGSHPGLGALVNESTPPGWNDWEFSILPDGDGNPVASLRVSTLNGGSSASGWSGPGTGVGYVTPQQGSFTPPGGGSPVSVPFAPRGFIGFQQESGGFDLRNVRFRPVGTLPPVVSAGGDRSVSVGQNVALGGSLSGPGAYAAWSVKSGPGTVTFSNAADPGASASFSAAGTYVLQLYAFDGKLRAFNYATITATSGSPLPPTISTQPQSQTVIAGNAASFSVQTMGSAPLHYQWRRGVTSVGGDSPSFSIPLALAADAGSYTVTVSNGVDPAAVSNVAVLTITARPGDVNGNGVINASDLNLVLGQFGARNGDAGWDSRCDLDANGRVDASDLSRVVRLQGQ